jgi:YD repeat-containing protein
MLAAPAQVGNLQVTGSGGGTLTWDSLPAVGGYNVYRGDISGLRTGNYGACLVGSVQGQNTGVPNDTIPVGGGVFFVVDAFDESGEGPVADPPAASPSLRCIPARRNFALTQDGDPGDGIADGTAPLRNPDAMLIPMHEATGAVLLHSGELVLSAIDLTVPIKKGDDFGKVKTDGNKLGNGDFGGGYDYSLGRHALHLGLPGSGGIRPGIARRRPRNWDGNYIYDPTEADPFDEPLPTAHAHYGFLEEWGIYYYFDHGSGGHTLGGGGGTGKVHFHDIPIQPPKPGGRRLLDVTGDAIADPFGCPRCPRSGGLIAAGGLAGAFDVARTYRSQVRYSGPLGRGWDSPANARLAPAGGGNVLFFDGTGRRDTFVRQDATHFAPLRGLYALLFQNGDGSFTLRDRDGALENFHAFDGSNRQGVFESAFDRQGDHATFRYDTQGLLTDVVDPHGRTIHYAYDAQGRVNSVTDYAGRQVVYGYDVNGNLASVRSPAVTGTPNGNDFPNGRTTQYTYTSGFADDRLNGNLIGVIRPNEAASMVPAMQSVYGTDAASFTFDRVTSQTLGGTNASGVAAGGTLTFSYQSLNAGGDPANLALPRRKATVLDRNGNQKEYVHNINGNLLSLTERTNRNVRAGEGDYTTQASYDSDGELILVLRPQGDRSMFAYDKPGADRYREGNLLARTDVADSLALGGRGDGHGGESNNRVWSFTYEPLFNQVASFTEPRGNDPAYVPQNGGPNTSGRYTTFRTFDYQEGDPVLTGVNAYAARFGIGLAGTPFSLGDLNGDGTTVQATGNVIRIADPTVHLDPGSNQAQITGSTLQPIVTTIAWNGRGQPIAMTDAEQNRHEFQYYAETDPEGDGVMTPPPLDGRTLDTLTGGFLKTVRIDTAPAPGRDNSVNPGPTQIQYDLAYDAYGNLSLFTDGRGVRTHALFNALGELVEVRSAAATADASGPDGTSPSGRGETGLQAFGFVTRYGYDADGNAVLAEHEDRGGTRGFGPFLDTHLTWDILGDLVQTDRQMTAASSLTSLFRYDANQNLTQLTEPDGNRHDRVWDERDLLFTLTRGAAGPLGGTPSTRRYDYDAEGNVATVANGAGGVTDYRYDGHDRLARVIDPVGGSGDLFYDPAGNVVRSLGRGTTGGPTPPDRSGSGNVDLADARFLYDEASRRFRTDRPLFVPAGVFTARPPSISEGSLLPGDGAVNTIFEYDRLSRPTFVHRDSGAVTRTDYDGAGRALLSTDAAGDTVARTYDAAANGIESVETQVSTNPGPVQEQFFTTSFYDALGRPTMAVDNLGDATRAVYDSLDAVTLTSDANGPSGGSINRRSSGHTGMTVSINGHGNVTRYAYDGADRLLTATRVLTANGRGDGTTNPTPDASNPSNPDGLIVAANAWMGDGLLAQWTDDRGNATSFAYDNLDRRVRTTRADNTFSTYAYDGEDAVTTTADPNGTHVTNFLDALGRPTMRTVDAGPGVAGTNHEDLQWDGLSRLTRSFANNQPADVTDDVTVSFLYDSLGRMIEETQTGGGGAVGGGAPLNTDVGWQADDLMTTLTYPSAEQVSYGYDSAERLRTMNDLFHPELMATFEYFGLDRLHTRQYGNGVRLSFLDDTGTTDTGYDGLGRPVRMRHLDPSNALLAGFEYRYDRNGNPTSSRRLHDSNAAGADRGNVYAYDSANRLTSSQEAYLDANHNIASPLLDQETWSLDGAGNWANFTRNGALYLNTPNDLNQYDEAQCCGAHTDDGVPDDFGDLASTPNADGINVVSDKAGDQIQGLSLKQQVIIDDGRHRPSAAIDLTSGAPIASYAYDGLGRRTRRQVSGGEGSQGTWTSAYAGTLLPEAIEERNVFGAVTLMAGVGPGGGCLWHLHGDGSSQYVLEDALGSAVAVVPGLFAGGPPQVLERVVYDPYGKPIFESPANVPLTLPGGGPFLAGSQYDSHHLFRGMVYDPELGARTASLNTDVGGLYADAGSYNPNQGRPMEGDPDRPPLNAGFDSPLGGGFNYSGNYSGGYSGNYSGNFSGNSAGNYSGNFAGDYSGNYSGNFSGNSSGNYSGNFSGDVVVGPSGEEIFTDKYGRIKVQFHWDRDGGKDHNSSTWIRVSRPWGGDGIVPWAIPCDPGIDPGCWVSGDPTNDPHDVNK